MKPIFHPDRPSFGETGQSFYRSTFFNSSKIGNHIIDFDLKCIENSLQNGKSSVTAEKVANRIWDHYADSSRLIKRSFGNSVKGM